MYPTPLSSPKTPRRSRRKPFIFSLVVLLVVAAYSSIVLTRPISQLQPTVSSSSLNVATPQSNLPWPGYGQGALGLADGTIVAQHGTGAALPMASTAKVVTALLVLQKYPLGATQSGPTHTITAEDVALYNHYVSIHGSVAAVSQGQQLTERQMLQALLLPSANNIADTLAIWAYGSVDNYITAANSYLQKKGLSDTKIGDDASGFSPSSVSTAVDLVKIGGLAMSAPALADIVGQKTAVIPGTGVVENYNSLLGSNGVVGVKTGNNDQNLGVFIGASKITVGGKQLTIVSALSGAGSLAGVLRDSGVILAAAPGNFVSTTIVQKGAVLGTYRQANGTVLQAVAPRDVNVTVLRGSRVRAAIALQKINYGAQSGQNVGSITVPASDFSAAQSVPIVLQQAPSKPSISYRLTHPF